MSSSEPRTSPAGVPDPPSLDSTHGTTVGTPPPPAPPEVTAAASAEATPKFKLTPAERARWIRDVWKPHRAFLIFLFALTVISSAVAIIYPLVFKLVLDRIAKPAPGFEISTVLWILGAVAVGRFVAGLYPGFRGWVNLKIDLDVRRKIFAAILEKDYRFFQRFRTGDLVTRLLDDIAEYPKIAWFSCSGLFRALDSACKLLLCVGAMLFLDWRLSLLAIAPLPIVLYLIYAVRSRLTEAYDAQQKAISRTNDMLEATFSGIRIVKAFSAEEGQAKALGAILRERIGIQFRVQRLWAIFQSLELVASRVGQLVVLGAGGFMVIRGEITLGTLYALYIYLDMLVQPLTDLPNLFVTARQAFVCFDREEEVLRFPDRLERGSSGPPIPRLESLELRNIDFAYQDGRAALQGLTFSAKRGERLAVVGAVAAGKSTLLKVAAGLLVPQTGTIRVNGRPIDEYAWESYRSRLGYAPQESLLFSESIRENVTLGRPISETAALARTVDEPATRGDGKPSPSTVAAGDGKPSPDGEAWVRRILSIAQMDSDLERMPQDLETVLGQKGTLVSGGQRQRISLARSLHSQPELLLLDDCTASLDAETEDRLWAGIESIAPDAIVLVVSHRLATIRRADRILVLDRGQLIDEGAHHELAERCDLYQRFLEREEERARILDSTASEA